MTFETFLNLVPLCVLQYPVPEAEQSSASNLDVGLLGAPQAAEGPSAGRGGTGERLTTSSQVTVVLRVFLVASRWPLFWSPGPVLRAFETRLSKVRAWSKQVTQGDERGICRDIGPHC